MPALTPGTIINVSNGWLLRVIAYIASGGQGEVYRVKRLSDNAEMALKWYTDDKIKDNVQFRSTLQHNCLHNPPSDTFLWPLAITETYQGSYGYVMRLRPEGYIDLGKYFCIDENPNAYFHSELAKLTASLQICDSFSRLHTAGYSYQDINDGSFIIDPKRGYVVICDNDNIVYNGYNNGISGKPHYMAPEVAEGSRPNTASDRFSLAIILYRLFMVDHPFEGERTAGVRAACMRPADERKLFGQKAVFCHDSNDTSNRPVEGLHDNSIRFWDALPPTLQRAFRAALSNKAINNPLYRIRASSWKEMLLCQRASLATCHADPEDPIHDYLCEGALPSHCPLCGHKTGAQAWLKFDGALPPYRLTEHKLLFLGDSFTPEGVCRKSSASTHNTLFLENLSHTRWIAVTPSGKQFTIAPGCGCQLADGIRLIIGNYRCLITSSL